jgi:hypothetical protein
MGHDDQSRQFSGPAGPQAGMPHLGFPQVMDWISIGRTLQKYQSRGNLLGRSTLILAGLPPAEPCKRTNPIPAKFNASKHITLVCFVQFAASMKSRPISWMVCCADLRSRVT